MAHLPTIPGDYHALKSPKILASVFGRLGSEGDDQKFISKNQQTFIMYQLSYKEKLMVNDN